MTQMLNVSLPAKILSVFALTTILASCGNSKNPDEVIFKKDVLWNENVPTNGMSCIAAESEIRKKLSNEPKVSQILVFEAHSPNSVTAKVRDLTSDRMFGGNQKGGRQVSALVRSENQYTINYSDARLPNQLVYEVDVKDETLSLVKYVCPMGDRVCENSASVATLRQSGPKKMRYCVDDLK